MLQPSDFLGVLCPVFMQASELGVLSTFYQAVYNAAHMLTGQAPDGQATLISASFSLGRSPVPTPEDLITSVPSVSSLSQNTLISSVIPKNCGSKGHGRHAHQDSMGLSTNTCNTKGQSSLPLSTHQRRSSKLPTCLLTTPAFWLGSKSPSAVPPVWILPKKPTGSMLEKVP